MTDDAGADVAAARKQALSVGVATGAYGLSLGALAVANGLSVWQACVTSLFLFSGGSQFALIGVLGSGGSVWAAVPRADAAAFGEEWVRAYRRKFPALTDVPWFVARPGPPATAI